MCNPPIYALAKKMDLNALDLGLDLHIFVHVEQCLYRFDLKMLPLFSTLKACVRFGCETVFPELCLGLELGHSEKKHITTQIHLGYSCFSLNTTIYSKSQRLDCFYHCKM